MKNNFNSKKHVYLLSERPFVYEFCAPWLDFTAFAVGKEGSEELMGQDSLRPGELHYLHLPRNRKLCEKASIGWLRAHEVAELEKEFNIIKKEFYGTEYIYRTDNFISMKGQEMAKFRRRVNQFKNTYPNYKIHDSYNLDAVYEFNNRWLESQKEKNVFFEDSFDFYRFCVKYQKKYGIKAIYVEVDGKLIGVAMGLEYNSKSWIGLHMKADYEYKGLSRFLLHERAKLFADKEIFTTGSSAEDKGIEKFKDELNPIEKVEYFYLVTGERLSKV